MKEIKSKENGIRKTKRKIRNLHRFTVLYAISLLLTLTVLSLVIIPPAYAQQLGVPMLGVPIVIAEAKRGHDNGTFTIFTVNELGPNGRRSVSQSGPFPAPFDSDVGGEDALAVGDVDGDGRDDIVIAEANSGTITIFDQLGNENKTIDPFPNIFDSDVGGRDALAVGTVKKIKHPITLCGDVVPADSDGNARRFLVNKLEDTEPGTGGCPTKCSLRAAIEEASNLAEQKVVIDVPAGFYLLTKGTLKITGGPKNFAINGAGSDLTKIDGGARITIDEDGHTKDATEGSLVFELSQAVTVHLSGVTIQNGHGTDSGRLGGGGGIRINSGSGLFLSNSVVRANVAVGFGAGIANYGFLRIFNCTIDENTIRNFFTLPEGGGYFTSAGGIYNEKGGTAQIYGSTISNNRANRGGGILNGGCLEITNSTISGNMANAGGGGIRNEGASPFIQPAPGRALILFSTITNNVAALNGVGEMPAPANPRRTGGGILNLGLLYMGDSILVANRQGRGLGSDPPAAFYSPDCYSSSTDGVIKERGTFTSLRNNLLGVINQNCNLRDALTGKMETVDRFFDKLGSPEAPLDPQFDFVDCAKVEDSCCKNPVRECRDEKGFPLTKPLLKQNGGLTKTIKLLDGSPAIDFADIRVLPIDQRTDQRGAIRPAGEAADAGAFELGKPEPITPRVVIMRSGFSYNRAINQFVQKVTLRNTSGSPISGQLFLALDGMNASLVNKAGLSGSELRSGVPYVIVDIGNDNVLGPQEVVSATLEFANVSSQGIQYTPLVFAGTGTP